MPNEPSAESTARAARLRAQIDKLTTPAADQPSGAPEKTAPLSPREFIEQQMNKLDRKE